MVLTGRPACENTKKPKMPTIEIGVKSLTGS
jgi:hypothetical protein